MLFYPGFLPVHSTIWKLVASRVIFFPGSYMWRFVYFIGPRKEKRNEQELFCYLKQSFLSLALTFLGDVLPLGWMSLVAPPLLSYTIVLFLMSRWMKIKRTRRLSCRGSCCWPSAWKNCCCIFLFLLFGISWEWQEDKKWPAVWSSCDSLQQHLILSIWAASSPSLCCVHSCVPSPSSTSTGNSNA